MATTLVTHAATADATTQPNAKAHEFAFRVVEFADTAACLKFFREKAIDFDQPNHTDWSLLMRICSCGRDDLVGVALDATTIVACATIPNRTNVLHLAAMSTNPLVMRELVASSARRTKLQPLINTPNINGDTPLMMASVAKNVVAVSILLNDLDASPALANANGLTPLMCAARVTDATPTQLAASAAIVQRLLDAPDTQVNAADVANGHTALHLAVLSQNDAAVAALLARSDVDVSLRSRARVTALELARRVEASAAIIERLTQRQAELEQEAAARSRAIAHELLVGEAGAETKAREKSNKATATNRTKAGVTKQEATTADKANDSVVQADEATEDDDDEEEADGTSSAVSIVHVPVDKDDNNEVEHVEDAHASGAWHAVGGAKQQRRKASLASARTTHHSIQKTTTMRHQQQQQQQQRKSTTQDLRVQKQAPAGVKRQASNGMKTTIASGLEATHGTAASSVSSTSTSVRNTNSNNTSVAQLPSTLARTPSPLTIARVQSPFSSPHNSTSNVWTYETLTALFHESFPLTRDLEVPVESFVHAASLANVNASTNSLSISQLDALQEAHLAAYHALNEQKIALTRVLEAQRVEAQFALEHEIRHLQ